MGLLAIHIILKAVNAIWPELDGRVIIYSDYLGALGRVADLPPHKIPSRCSHSDILKIILVNCTALSFTLQYAHAKPHQDDKKDFTSLTRAAQLNVHCDGMAKNVLWGFSGSDHPRQKTFPLEPVAVFVGDDKLTSCMHKTLRFWIHKQIAMDTFFQLGLISSQNF